MSELKPCWSCGGNVEIRPADFRMGVSINTTDAVIYCPTCDEVFGGGYNKSKLQLVEWWNTSAERTCRVK